VALVPRIKIGNRIRLEGSDMQPTSFRCVGADAVRVFYREVGLQGAPVVLLLHGFSAEAREVEEIASTGRRLFRAAAG
jgi:hypothetical protein